MNMPYPEMIVEEAVALAETWQERANALLRPDEKAFQKRLIRLLSHSMDKVILTQMIDQGLRSKNPDRVARRISSLLKRYGVPQFLSPAERLAAHLFLTVGRYFPAISIPIITHIIRKQSSRFILPGEEKPLLSLLRKRKNVGVRMNINHLGEAVLGEEEALAHLNMYLEDLRNPEIDCISVKISSLYSQILPIAFEYSVSILKDRLSMLYRTAQKNASIQRNGKRVPKSVNLDMEGYQDLGITATTFMRTLDDGEFTNYSGGIALQAYLPDSYEIQQKLTAWAKERVKIGGHPIRIRIVKGANLEMEKIESAVNNWPLATFDNKLDVDANFKRMIEFGMMPDNIEAVHLGIASHNLFELAYAYRLAGRRKVTKYLTFEMIEGMADHVSRVIRETCKDMLLYAPVVSNDRFINALAYLIRRLDENTGKENFLRYASNLKTDSSEWWLLKEQFIASCRQTNHTPKITNRVQDRMAERFEEKGGAFFKREFVNEPNTDWSLPANRKWAESIRERWKKGTDHEPFQIPLVVAGKEIYKDRQIIECIDPSQLSNKTEDKICVARCASAEDEDVENAVNTAKADPDHWRNTGPPLRQKILSKVAINLRKARGDLMGSAAADTGKIFTEADVEVSEAVDFAEYYPYSLRKFQDNGQVTCRGKGVGVVISPWNFPIAIPCGGLIASLAAGNTVILKPSSSAIIPAWQLCRCFWQGGISRNVLQFLPGNSDVIGPKLTGHPDVDFIIFTGGTGTGLKILRQRPDVYLAGETGGKNATIITAMSDRDLAIKNVVHSAFSNCGQKCSATSLLILEREVYEDTGFRKQLVDAAKSCSAGSAWEFKNRMGPLIHPPEGMLKIGISRLEAGEEWALKPENIKNNPYLWTPSIKWGVQPGSFTHMTEFFGPLLGVMRARNLDHAIELANKTGYGLTSALESLDQREQEYWKLRIKAGNLYINRGTTGAIILRQPFGGMGKSALGAGIKAGGPNYVIQFMDIEDTASRQIGEIKNDHPLIKLLQEWKAKLNQEKLQKFQPDFKKTMDAVDSYLSANEREFSREKDYFSLRGQDNIVRYLPIGTVAVRLHHEDNLFEILARIAAVRISGCGLTISMPQDLENKSAEFFLCKEGKQFADNAEILSQSDMDLINMMPRIHGIRYAGPDRVTGEIFEAAAKTGFYISRTKVVAEGRIELLQYYQEQSICNDYHRYGNLGERATS